MRMSMWMLQHNSEIVVGFDVRSDRKIIIKKNQNNFFKYFSQFCVMYFYILWEFKASFVFLPLKHKLRKKKHSNMKNVS